MSMVAFLRRLAGTSHEGVVASNRFEDNLRSVVEQEKELEKLQGDVASIVARVVQTQRRIRATNPPSSFSGEYLLDLPPGVLGEQDERERERLEGEGTNGTSDDRSDEHS